MRSPADFRVSRPPDSGEITVALGRLPIGSGPPVQHPRQLDHDIQHELGTIALLASLLGTATDVGPDSRRRAEQIVEETRWLNRLVRAASSLMGLAVPDVPAQADTSERSGRPVRLDAVAAEVVSAARLSTTCAVCLEAGETWARVDPLTFWRLSTNLVGNAVRAAGAYGEVHVTVCADGGRAVVEIDDNGPGFGAGPTGYGAHGLDIARDMVLSMAGELQIGDSRRGGCRVRLSLRMLPSGYAEGWRA
jgi:signal transduction histidine kinase